MFGAVLSVLKSSDASIDKISIRVIFFPKNALKPTSQEFGKYFQKEGIIFFRKISSDK